MPYTPRRLFIQPLKIGRLRQFRHKSIQGFEPPDHFQQKQECGQGKIPGRSALKLMNNWTIL